MAVRRFLADMKKAADKTYKAWLESLEDGIEDCPLTYDTRRALVDIHPLDDYYFAGAVALEAAKIRPLFTKAEADELLGLIGETVDAAADRQDRVVSDLVFFIIGRIETVAAADSQKKSYDQVVKVILQRIGIDSIEATTHLLTQPLFRHVLGEHLALGVPDWWTRFHSKYTLARPRTAAPHSTAVQQAVAAAENGRRRPPRRAAVF